MPFKGIEENSLAYKFYISDNLAEKTFVNELLLPDLPVPTLENTISRYLKSIRPFVADDEYKKTKEITKNFQNGIGKDLHEKLLHRAQNEKNWLDEWWLKYCYLSLRNPIAPCINMAGVQSLHFTIWNDPSENNAIERAAIALWAKLQFYKLLREERLKEQFSLKGDRLSMNQFRYLYNTTRIPKEDVDELYAGFKTKREGDCAQHLICICRGHLWVLNPWDSRGELLTVQELEKQMLYIQKLSNDMGDAVGVAALTADYREVWAKNRVWLASLTKKNADVLALVETAVSAIIIDNQKPKNYGEAFHMSLCGNPINRWADKSYGAIMFENGYCTSSNDHTPYDAMVTVVLGHFQHELITNQFRHGIDRSVAVENNYELPKRIEFDLDDMLLNAIQKAKEVNNTFRNNIQASIYVFECFGKDFMKSQSYHPDAFIQCALQLAYYKLHKRFAPTYETATTRQFYKARTETVRSCSSEFTEFILAFQSKHVSTMRKKMLLTEAMSAHVVQMRECQVGQGVDRHMFGLGILAMESGQDFPEIFTDPSFIKSGGGGNYVLSTSTIGYSYMVGGVAPMVNDGYGLFYGILPDRLQFTMSVFNSGDTGLEKMKESIKASLLEMQDLCLEFTSKI